MTKSVQKVLIFALLVLYLSWETSAAAIIDVESPLKCGNLECPNGSVACETRHEPNDDNKTVTITSQCRDSESNFVFTEKNILLQNISGVSCEKCLANIYLLTNRYRSGRGHHS